MIHGIIKFVNYRIIPKYSDLGRALDKIPEHDCSLGPLGTLEGDKIHSQPVFFATFVQFLRNLSMLHPQELSNLHPKIHAYIIEELMKKWVFLMSLTSPKIPKLPTQFFDILINATRHPNLHADVSWDVLSKQLLMNYDPKLHNVSLLHEVIQIHIIIPNNLVSDCCVVFQVRE